MKRIFAILLVMVSTLAQAQKSTLEKVEPQINQVRAALLESAKPFTRSLLIDELVEKMEMHDVDVIVTTKSVPGGAMYFPGIILVGVDVIGLPRAQLAYVLAHEYGHHTRMHWTSTLSRGAGLAYAAGKEWSTFEEISKFTDQAMTPEFCRSNELDADRAAVLLLKSFGQYDQKAVASLLSKIAEPSDTDTHPSASTRIAAMAAIH